MSRLQFEVCSWKYELHTYCSGPSERTWQKKWACGGSEINIATLDSALAYRVHGPFKVPEICSCSQDSRTVSRKIPLQTKLHSPCPLDTFYRIKFETLMHITQVLTFGKSLGRRVPSAYVFYQLRHDAGHCATASPPREDGILRTFWPIAIPEDAHG